MQKYYSKWNQKYTLLLNRGDNSNRHWIYLPIRQDAEKYSFWRLKKRFKSCQTEWNYFITLTFSPAAEVKSKGIHIIPKQKIGRVLVQGYNGHIYESCTISSYLATEFTRKFTHVPLNMVRYNLIRKTLDLLRHHESRREHPTKLKYAWRFERGKLGGREHYHLLIQSTICHTCLYFLLEEIWQYGYVDLKRLENSKAAEKYIGKYFYKHTKQNNLRVLTRKKRWSFSQNNEFIEENRESDWEFYGQIEGRQNAIDYFLSTLQDFLTIHHFKFATYLYNDINKDEETINHIRIKELDRRHYLHELHVKRHKFRKICELYIENNLKKNKDA